MTERDDPRRADVGLLAKCSLSESFNSAAFPIIFVVPDSTGGFMPCRSLQRPRPAQITCSSICPQEIESLAHDQPDGLLCAVDSLRFVSDPAVKLTPATVSTLHALVSHCSRLTRLRVEDYSVQIRSQLLRVADEELSLARLRELDWFMGLNVNFDSVPLLLQLLQHTPRLERLRVSPDLSMLPLRMLAEFPPTHQRLQQSAYYSFRLRSFECTGVLSAFDIAQILTCSAATLANLSLVVHAAEVGDLVYRLPAFPAVTTLLLLPVDGSFDSDVLVEFLSRVARLSHLTIGLHDHANPIEFRAIADAPAIHLQTLKLYSLERTWRPADARVLVTELRKLRPLRRLELIAAGFSNAAVALLCQECARRRVAFLMGVLNHADEYFLP